MLASGSDLQSSERYVKEGTSFGPAAHPHSRRKIMQSTPLVIDNDVDQRPEPSPISPAALVLMNFGFFGIQFSFGLQ